MTKEKNYTKGYVTSKDGTKIGYRQMGSGPCIILLHGGIMGSQNLMKLGTALSDKFTVYLPDRRGRGMSGPFGENYSMEREIEDLNALLIETDANYIFGSSTGGLIALQASLRLQAIHKIVAYEAHLYVNKEEMENFNDIIHRYDEELAEGKWTDAMLTGMDTETKVSNDPMPSPILHLPDFVWRAFFRVYLEVDDRNVKGDDVTIRDLMPTLHNDILLVNETKGKLNNFKEVPAEVLLLNGSKSPKFLKHSTEALTKVLPHVKHIELQGLNHDSAQNYGKPEIIANEIKQFL